MWIGTVGTGWDANWIIFHIKKYASRLLHTTEANTYTMSVVARTIKGESSSSDPPTNLTSRHGPPKMCP